MALPTPLLSLVEINQAVLRQNVTDTTTDARLLATAREMVQLVQAHCNRRFDEYITTRYYTARLQRNGGDLVTWLELSLGADVKSVSAIVGGDGTTIPVGQVKLVPRNSPAYQMIYLPATGSYSWGPGANDPVDAIEITGTWGYGGDWVGLTTLGANIADTSTLTLTAAGVSPGMYLKIGTEYLIVSAVSGTTVTVEGRGANGSTPATHTSGDPVYRWVADGSVLAQIKRLLQWKNEQLKSPLFGAVVVGNTEYPIISTGMPQDVIDALWAANLVRSNPIVGA